MINTQFRLYINDQTMTIPFASDGRLTTASETLRTLNVCDLYVGQTLRDLELKSPEAQVTIEWKQITRLFFQVNIAF